MCSISLGDCEWIVAPSSTPAQRLPSQFAALNTTLSSASNYSHDESFFMTGQAGQDETRLLTRISLMLGFALPTQCPRIDALSELPYPLAALVTIPRPLLSTSRRFTTERASPG